MTRRLGDIDGWLTLSADAFITLVVLQSSLGDMFGARLPWWRVTVPLLVANVVAAGIAQRKGYTAMPFGPNTVFVLAFFGAVLKPLNEVWREQGMDTAMRAAAALELTAASLWIYGGLLVLFTYGVVVFRPNLSRRALLIPLAAICWCYLVVVPLTRLAGESHALWIPALVLALLLWRRTPPGVPFLAAGGLWLILYVFSNAESLWALPERVLDINNGMALSWSVLSWFGRAELWVNTLPVLIVLSLANTFGLLENVAAAREVGDNYDARVLVRISAGGIALAALFTSVAPITVYIGHPAYKRRGAGWVFAILAAFTLFGATVFLPDRWLLLVPVPVFYGAVLYVGASVGMLPRAHLRSVRELVLALVAGAPVFAGWASRAWSVDGLSFLGRGGGLISVGWALLLLGALGRNERTALLLMFAGGSVAGLVHTPALSTAAWVAGAVYLGLAALSWYPRGKS